MERSASAAAESFGNVIIVSRGFHPTSSEHKWTAEWGRYCPFPIFGLFIHSHRIDSIYRSYVDVPITICYCIRGRCGKTVITRDTGVFNEGFMYSFGQQ